MTKENNYMVVIHNN